MMTNFKNIVCSLLAVFLLVSCASGPKVTKGQVVKVTYKATLKDGEVFDTTEGKDPLTFLVGSGQVLPAFEKRIEGLRTGSKKKFTIPSAEAYGASDPKKVVTLPKGTLTQDPNTKLEEGSVVFISRKLPNGQQASAPVRILKVTDEEVTVDANHPLAGQDLTFNIKIEEIVAPETDVVAQADTAAEATPAAH